MTRVLTLKWKEIVIHVFGVMEGGYNYGNEREMVLQEAVKNAEAVEEMEYLEGVVG